MTPKAEREGMVALMEDAFGPAKDRRFSVTLRSSSEAVRQTLSLITAHFAGRVSAIELGTLEMVLVEHAMPEDEHGQVKLRISPRTNGLACTVLDSGSPMPGGEPPKENLPGIGSVIDDLPEGGFGWSLIRMHVQGLDYQRKDGCNVLRFVLPWEPVVVDDSNSLAF